MKKKVIQSITTRWLQTAAALSLTLTLAPAALPAPAVARSLEAAPTTQADDREALLFQQAEAELPEDLYVLYRIVERMARANGLTERHWRVAIDPDYTINAYAYEANLITLYSGLLDQLDGDTSAVACVVGHEMAHHVRRHIPIRVENWLETMENLEEAENVDVGELLSWPEHQLEQWAMQFKANYYADWNDQQQAIWDELGEKNRDQERESDALGYRYAVQAGFDPSGCVRLMQMFNQLPYSASDSFTHPAVPDRIAAMEGRAAEQPADSLAPIGAMNLARSQPLSYEWAEPTEEGAPRWLRINSPRGDSLRDDFQQRFGQGTN